MSQYNILSMNFKLHGLCVYLLYGFMFLFEDCFGISCIVLMTSEELHYCRRFSKSLLIKFKAEISNTCG